MTSDSPQLKGALFGFRRASVRQLLAGRETMFRFAQERAQTAEAKVEELQAELKAIQADYDVQMEAAGSAHAETRAELREATDALREEIERVALTEAKLSELQSELARAREAERQHADSLRKLASVETELETTRSDASARAQQARSAEARVHELQAQLEAAHAEPAQHAGEPRTAPTAEAQDLTLMLSAAERGVTGIMERARHAYEAQLAQADLVRETIHADIERFGDWQGQVEPLIRSVQQGLGTAWERIVRIPQQIQEAVDSMTDAISAMSDSLDRLATLPSPLSTGLTPGGEEFLDTPADTVVRLQSDDPVVPPPFRATSGGSKTDGLESDETMGGSSQVGSEEERDGSDQYSHGGPLRNHHR